MSTPQVAQSSLHTQSSFVTLILDSYAPLPMDTLLWRHVVRSAGWSKESIGQGRRASGFSLSG